MAPRGGDLTRTFVLFSLDKSVFLPVQVAPFRQLPEDVQLLVANDGVVCAEPLVSGSHQTDLLPDRLVLVVAANQDCFLPRLVPVVAANRECSLLRLALGVANPVCSLGRLWY